jgi:hypothetical protein
MMPRNYDRKHAAEEAEWDPTVAIYGGKYAADDGFRDDIDETRRSKTAREMWSFEKATRYKKKFNDFQNFQEIARLKRDGRHVTEPVNPDDYTVEKDEQGIPIALRTWNNTLYLAEPGLRPKSRGPNARTRRHAERARARVAEKLEEGTIETKEYHDEMVRIKGTLGKPKRPVPQTQKVPSFGPAQKPGKIREKIEEKNRKQIERKQKTPERRSTTLPKSPRVTMEPQTAKPWVAKEGPAFVEKTRKITNKADKAHAERVSKKALGPPE